jgi:hypothetical protein
MLRKMIVTLTAVLGISGLVRLEYGFSFNTTH